MPSKNFSYRKFIQFLIEHRNTTKKQAILMKITIKFRQSEKTVEVSNSYIQEFGIEFERDMI